MFSIQPFLSEPTPSPLPHQPDLSEHIVVTPQEQTESRMESPLAV